MRYINFPKEFWVVTYPYDNKDRISDIMFKSNLKDLLIELNRNLDFEEIYAIHGKHKSAKKDATSLLSQLESGEIEPYLKKS